MSRFFRGSDSESESSSNEEEIVPQRPAVSKAFQFSDEDDDAKRVVRSAKDKRFDEIRNIIRQLKNHKKIKDMSNVLTDFESLGKAYDKAKKVFVISNEEAPRFYVRCLVELEDFVNQCWEDKDGRRQMSKNNAKGLTTLRQRLRKYNRTFEQEIKSYRENPDIGDPDVSDEEEESDSDDIDNDIEEDVIDNELLKNFKKSPVTDVVEDISSKFKQAVVDLESEDADDGEDENYVDWGDQDETGDKSSDDQGDSTYLASLFLKRTTAAEAAKKEEKKREKRKDKKGKKRDDEDDDDDDDEGEWEEVKGGAPMLMEKPKMFGKDVEINHEAVIKKLNEIVSARGKKGTDRSEQIDILKELLSVSEAHKLGPAMSSKIIFNIIAAIFDYNPNIATNMKPEMWERCKDYVLMQLSLLLEHKDITVSENMTEDSENLEEPPYRIRGCILTVVERMDEEFKKMLQGCDPHSTEYIERLKDERVVCDVIEKLQGYLEDEKVPTKEMCRGYLRRIEHTYYKTNGGEEAKELIARLCKYIYSKDQTDRLRTRAILCHIYHHAIHDRWFEARDLMLMSHLQDTIQHSDITTQIQYNRTLVQLGLCAFRQGMIKDSHNALVDIQSIGRAKELLAQGLLLQRQHERTPEQELIEKRRQMPYHMHINLELLECVYLVSAMLIEIPYMAAHEFDGRRRMISRNYHNLLRNSERQTLTGPPESMREHIVAASKSMKTGNWCACTKFVINEKMNAKVWDLFNDADKVRKMIRQKIQEESLRTYLFTYSSVYDTLSMVKLGEMFELETSVVHAIISKMIFNEELMASLDEPTQSIVMHRTEPSRLQSLALQLSEKISNLVDNNDRIIDMKPGSTYYQKSGLSGYDQGQQQNRWSKGQNQWDKGQRQNQWGGRSQQNQWGRRQQRMRVY